MTFELIRLRFQLRAADSLYFPSGKAGNVLRGALGTILHESLFAPKSAGAGWPSGLADPPRPFVLRAAHLDGRMISPEVEFHFDVHLFDSSGALCGSFAHAFSSLAAQGFGPGRGRAALLSIDEKKISVDLDDAPESRSGVLLQFVTPTELKAGPEPVTRPEFPVLFARLRDRISTLRAFYGPGPLEIDFRAIAARAAQVRLVRCELNWHDVERRSSRTGQTHPLGGFTGLAEYAGDLGEFLPYLRAGQWTGVGRQTVWGKGEICLQHSS